MKPIYEFKDGKSFYKGIPVVSVEESFSDGMIERLDEIDNITLNYLEKMYGEKIDRTKPGITEIIGTIVETAEKMLNEKELFVCYPYTGLMNLDENANINLLCTHLGDCPKFKNGDCPYKDELYTSDFYAYDIKEEDLMNEQI